MRKAVIITVVVVVLGAAAWYWFVYLSPAPTTTNQATNQSVNQGVTPANTNTPTSAVPEPQDPTLGWRVLAMNFAERYGTYSTDLPYQNLKTLSSLVTAEFQARLQAQVANSTPAQGFYSVTTRALMVDTVGPAGDTLTVNVATQRSERFARDAAPQLSYPVLQLTLSGAGETWLVSSAAWQK